MENARYMISDAANIVNVESHVLRYWEEELELAIPRNEMGHRYYTEENIAQFQKIKEWKEQGYQLKAIRMMIHNSAGGNQVVETKREYSEVGSSYPVKHHGNSAANTVKLEQFQAMMTNIVKQAMAENNTALGKEVGVQVGEKVLKEMNYLSHPRAAQRKEIWQGKTGEREECSKNTERREEIKPEFNYLNNVKKRCCWGTLRKEVAPKPCISIYFLSLCWLQFLFQPKHIFKSKPRILCNFF